MNTIFVYLFWILASVGAQGPLCQLPNLDGHPLCQSDMPAPVQNADEDDDGFELTPHCAVIESNSISNGF